MQGVAATPRINWCQVVPALDAAPHAIQTAVRCCNEFFEKRVLISCDGWRVACLVVNNLKQKERVHRVGGFRAGCSNPNLCAPFYFRDFVVNLTFQSHFGHLLPDQSGYWLAASVP
jgi:hypothetical protein